jgi:hypothetical protein
MANSYSPTSPYYQTPVINGYLDVATFRNIPAVKGDRLFTVTSKYENRPDLLSNDLYGDSRFWWVFAVRNKTAIQDPIFDLVAGMKIYIPDRATLKNVLGV